jgi:hypothetical protein
MIVSNHNANVIRLVHDVRPNECASVRPRLAQILSCMSRPSSAPAPSHPCHPWSKSNHRKIGTGGAPS